MNKKIVQGGSCVLQLKIDDIRFKYFLTECAKKKNREKKLFWLKKHVQYWKSNEQYF